MSQSAVKTKRNQSIECFRLLAALIVMFSHYRFPEPLSGIIVILCTYCVPLFLMISGYFSLGATCRQLWQRIKHVICLALASDGLWLIWRCIREELNGGSTIALLRTTIPDPDELFCWLIFQRGLFQRYLWYLSALILCYFVLLLYTAFQEKPQFSYRPLYGAGFVLFTAYFILAILLPSLNVVLDELIFRNGWFTGIPMFLTGMFLREHSSRFQRCLHLDRKKTMLIAAGSIFLSLYQESTIGVHNTPFAMPFGAIAILLFVCQCPVPFPENSWIARHVIPRFGQWSTGIYLFHMTAGNIVDTLFVPELAVLPEAWIPWLTPLLIFAVTMLITLFWDWCCRLTSHIRHSRRPH